MIGWPQFETKDGKTYDRIWAPGSGRVPPCQQDETVQDLSGTIQRRVQAMIYGRPHRSWCAQSRRATKHGSRCMRESTSVLRR
jgi:hypothetical protein